MDDQSKTNQTNPEMAPENVPNQTENGGEQTPVSAATTTDSADTSGTPMSMKSIIITALVLLLIGAGAYWFMSQGGGENPLTGQSNTPLGDREYPEVVATVNGEDVPLSDFQQAMTQFSAMANQRGADLSNPSVQAQVEEQAITILTNRLLLLQAAAEAGVEVTEAEIEEQLTVLENQYGGEAGLQQQMDGIGLTAEQLRIDVGEQLSVDGYIRSTDEFNNIEVSDEEVQAMYDSMVANAEDAPPFEDLQVQLRAQLEAQAEQSAVEAIVERLRNAAEVEINL